MKIFSFLEVKFFIYLNWRVFVMNMILLADREGPDQMRAMRRLTGLGCPHMPEDTFSHGAAQI